MLPHLGPGLAADRGRRAGRRLPDVPDLWVALGRVQHLLNPVAVLGPGGPAENFLRADACEYGSLPGYWKPEEGSIGSWTLLSNRCQIKDLLSDHIARVRAEAAEEAQG